MRVRMVLNKGFGLFGLSDDACRMLGLHPETDYEKIWNIDRTNPELIKVVETLGEKAGKNLKIVTVNIELGIEANDGYERVHVHGQEV